MMKAQHKLALAGALASLTTSCLAGPAFAHAVCGNRIFPATLAIDDPGVSDELALPTMSFVPKNSDGVQEVDASLSYTKTILPGLGISFTDGRTWLHPGGAGWGNLDTELKYNIWCDAPHEFMGSVGLDVSWARYGTKNFSDPFNTVLAGRGHRQGIWRSAGQPEHLETIRNNNPGEPLSPGRPPYVIGFFRRTRAPRSSMSTSTRPCSIGVLPSSTACPTSTPM